MELSNILGKELFILSKNALLYGERIAFRTAQACYTFQEWDAWSWSVEQALLARGLCRGQRILVLARPSMEKVVVWAAMMRAGLVFAPVSPKLPVEQRWKMAQQVNAVLCLCDDSVTTLPDRLPVLSFDELLREALTFSQVSVTPSFIEPQQEATLVWTSGSSRQPKAVLHHYQNHLYSALGSNQNIVLKDGDHWLLSLPMFHVAGIAIAMRSLVAGTAIDFPSPEESLKDSLLRLRPTHVSMVSTQLIRALHDQELRLFLQETKAILLGGSAIPSSLLREAAALKLPIYVSYGSTEMASQITTTRSSSGLTQWYGAGYVLPHRELRLSEEHEIWVRGETRFAGYLTSSGLTTPFDQEGWFATGDLGEWQPDGSLRVLGRKDAMFISGGENIQPEEIEWALEQHEDVIQATVVAVPDHDYGARPHAFVRMRAEYSMDVDCLKKHLATYVAKFKIPDRFHPWPTNLPSNGIKVNRTQLLKTICDIL